MVILLGGKWHFHIEVRNQKAVPYLIGEHSYSIAPSSPTKSQPSLVTDSGNLTSLLAGFLQQTLEFLSDSYPPAELKDTPFNFLIHTVAHTKLINLQTFTSLETSKSWLDKCLLPMIFHIIAFMIMVTDVRTKTTISGHRIKE